MFLGFNNIYNNRGKRLGLRNSLIRIKTRGTPVGAPLGGGGDGHITDCTRKKEKKEGVGGFPPIQEEW